MKSHDRKERGGVGADADDEKPEMMQIGGPPLLPAFCSAPPDFPFIFYSQPVYLLPYPLSLARDQGSITMKKF